MEVHRIDTHKDKSKSVFAMGTTRKVWKAEKAALDIMLVLGYRWGSY
jgi:hypothetical protein